MLTVKNLDSYIVECLLHFTDDEISMKSVGVWVWLLAEILLLFFYCMVSVSEAWDSNFKIETKRQEN